MTSRISSKATLENPGTDRLLSESHLVRAAQPGHTFLSLTGAAPAWLVSLVLHALGIGLLVVLTLGVSGSPQGVHLVATHETSQADDELLQVEFPIEPELDLQTFDAPAPPPQFQTADVAPSEIDPNLLGDSPQAAELAARPLDALDGVDAEGLMTELAGLGEGMGQKTSFFGTGAAGKRIVFVVDNSTSMTHGRMETALVELDKSVRRLSDDQEFYIVFYSDMAYPLFYPASEHAMIPATQENKVRVHQWLGTIETCAQTTGREAFTMALRLKPDVIYILGDGKIWDEADVELARTPLSGVIVHTLGMQVKRSEARRFRAIASAHGGTYKDVGITEQGKHWLREHGPIPRNEAPDGVWGLKLSAF